MHFRFPPAPHSGRKVLELRGLGKSYGDLGVISDLELVLERGEKLVITGRNGAGKSTLMRILAGEDRSYRGEVSWGTDVRTAYFSQDHEEALDGTLTVLEEVEKEAPIAMIPRLRDLLGSFLFRGDEVQKRVSVLSGGEKNRLTLVKLLLRPANVLLLDEPTNHLDLASKDVLLEALSLFEGTVVFVSHDRYFIQKLAGKVLELGGGRHRLFPGDWDYYQDRLAREIEDTVPAEGGRTSSVPKSDSQLSREETKQRQAQRRRWEREEAELFQSIEREEAAMKALEEEMSRPEVYSDGPRIRSLQEKAAALESEIDAAHRRWEEVARLLEEAGT